MQKFEDIIEDAIEWSSTNGFVMRHSAIMRDNLPTPSVLHAPFTLRPSPFDRRSYELVMSLPPLINSVMHGVSRDLDFIKRQLASTASVDPFIARLLQVAELAAQRRVQPLEMGILRTDYMLNKDSSGAINPLQVEINAISSALPALSTRVCELHHRMNSMHQQRLYAEPEPLAVSQHQMSSSLNDVADAMAAAIRAFKASDSDSSHQVAMLMIVQANDFNLGDQRLLQWSLEQRHQILTIRRTFDQLVDLLPQFSSTNDLIIDGYQVGLVYYRAAYTPNDFTREIHWQVLETIELSTAIKCPTTAIHLSGRCCYRSQC